MPIETLTELQYASPGTGPWRLYIYDTFGRYHSGGVWFDHKPKYPGEGEITTARAKELAVAAMAKKREVRICDGGDLLVFHAKDGHVLFGARFWAEIGGA